MKQIKLILLTLFLSAVVKAGVQEHYAMYGVFFYNFTKYIQWPDEYNQGDFEVMVLGQTPMTEELKKLAERKKLNGRSYKVTEISSVNDIKKCHVLFLPSANSQILAEVAKKLKGSATLLVTEKEGLARKGSAINYVEKDGKPTFEINLEVASEHKLKVFSELSKWGVVM